LQLGRVLRVEHGSVFREGDGQRRVLPQRGTKVKAEYTGCRISWF
jgi:hypothetical protein